MRKNKSMRMLLRLNAVVALCLCLLTVAPALAAGALFTKEQAVALVKDRLKADDAWLVEVVGMTDIAGAAHYRIVITDPVGDARCRLVNAGTGEVVVESLWNAASQSADGEQDGEGECRGDGQDENGRQDTSGEQDGEPEENDDADADAVENQQEGEFDTADEPTAQTVPTAEPAISVVTPA